MEPVTKILETFEIANPKNHFSFTFVQVVAQEVGGARQSATAKVEMAMMMVMVVVVDCDDGDTLDNSSDPGKVSNLDSSRRTAFNSDYP